MSHKIECLWKSNMTFEADVDDHIITMDIDPMVGGEGLGPRPKLLLLAGLAGCTGMDVISILKKMRLEPEYFNISVEGDVKEEHPKYYNKIHIIYFLKGKDLDMEKVQKAVELSQEKYCGVSAQLRMSAEITYEIRLNED
jgi:putative redox protein